MHCLLEDLMVQWVERTAKIMVVPGSSPITVRVFWYKKENSLGRPVTKV